MFGQVKDVKWLWIQSSIVELWNSVVGGVVRLYVGHLLRIVLLRLPGVLHRRLQ